MEALMGKRTAKRPEDAEARLERLASAFEAKDFGGALALAEALLAEAPGLVEALHYRAAVLAEQDHLEEAARAYHRALKASPEDLKLILAAADFLLCRMGEDREAAEDGLLLCLRGRRLAEHLGHEEQVYGFLMLEGMGLNQVGECEKALSVLNEALEHQPRSVDAMVERGIALFELCRFKEAHGAFERALRESPQEAWAHHYLGLLAERREDVKEARKRFAKAQALLPEEFPPPVQLSEEEFDQALEAAVKALPEHVKGYLDNVTISVEHIPSDEELTGQNPPLSPCILGVFRGTPVGERSVMDAYDHFPAAIVLYQKNLERFAKTRKELIEQVGITVMHEVGHLVGLDEDDLWERGLD
jgi:predicted Zn-dependent protease with MMP-like domain/Flp pilus assembly protein TadD